MDHPGVRVCWGQSVVAMGHIRDAGLWGQGATGTGPYWDRTWQGQGPAGTPHRGDKHTGTMARSEGECRGGGACALRGRGQRMGGGRAGGARTPLSALHPGVPPCPLPALRGCPSPRSRVSPPGLSPPSPPRPPSPPGAAAGAAGGGRSSPGSRGDAGSGNTRGSRARVGARGGGGREGGGEPGGLTRSLLETHPGTTLRGCREEGGVGGTLPQWGFRGGWGRGAHSGTLGNTGGCGGETEALTALAGLGAAPQ